MKSFAILIVPAVFLTACISSDAYREASYIGEESGKDIYQFEVFSYASNPPSYVDNSIAHRTREWCPSGYDLLKKEVIKNGSTTAPVGDLMMTQRTRTYLVRARCK